MLEQNFAFVLNLEVISESLYWKCWKYLFFDLEKIHYSVNSDSTSKPLLTKNEDLIGLVG